MKLVSLKLLNYRRFKQEEIFFKDNFTLIFGKNWSWKSSILDAIWYALFWPSSKDFVRVNTQLLKSHFVKDRQSSKIELVFALWMDNYRIIRVIDPWIKKLSNDFIIESKDSLYWPDWLEIIGGSEVSSYIQSLVWINRDTFLRSVFAKQKDLEVLSWSKEDRKKLINSILGLDKIEFLIIDNKKVLKEKKILKDYLQNNLENFDFDENEKQTKILEEKILDETNQFDLISKNREEIIKKYENIKLSYDLEEKKYKLFNELNHKLKLENNNLENINFLISQLNKNLDEILKKETQILNLKDIPKKRQDLQKQLNILIENRQKYSQIQKLSKDLEIFENNKKSIDLEIKNYQKINFETNLKEIWDFILKLEDKNNFLQKDLIEKKSIVWKLIADGKELKQEYENFKNLGENWDCPTCKRPIDKDFPNIIKFFEDKISQKREEYSKKNSEVLDIEKEIRDNSNLLNDKKNVLKDVQEQEKKYILLNNNLENLYKNIESINKDLENLWNINFDENNFNFINKEFQEIEIEFNKFNILTWEISKKQEIISSLEKNKILLNNFQNNILQIKKDLENIDFDENKYELNKKDFNEINSQIFEINSKISEKQTYLNNLNLEINLLKNSLKEVKESKWKIDFINEEIIYLNLKNEVLNEYIIHLLNFLKPNIESLASQYFSIITDNRYSSITLDEEYNILIDERSIDLYSGWERDLANLCLRLSLWQNITSNNSNFINFLVMDEVLASQDKSRQQNILINFKKLEQKFSQIFLISHVDDIKEMATNMIEVKQKNIEESNIQYY